MDPAPAAAKRRQTGPARAQRGEVRESRPPGVRVNGQGDRAAIHAPVRPRTRPSPDDPAANVLPLLSRGEITAVLPRHYRCGTPLATAIVPCPKRRADRSLEQSEEHPRAGYGVFAGVWLLYGRVESLGGSNLGPGSRRYPVLAAAQATSAPRINQAQLVEKRHRRIPGPVPARSRSREPAGRSRRKPPAVSPLAAAAPRSDDRRCARNPAGHDPEVRINLGRRAERSDYRPPSIGQAPNRRGLGTVEQDGLRMEFLVASPITWNNSCCGEPIVQVHHVGRLLVLPCLRSDTVAIWPALFEALEGSMSMGTGRGSFCAEISLAGNLYAAGFRWAGYRIASGRRFSCPPCLMGQSATSTGPMPWRAAPSRDPERIEAINRLLDSFSQSPAARKESGPRA